MLGKCGALRQAGVVRIEVRRGCLVEVQHIIAIEQMPDPEVCKGKVLTSHPRSGTDPRIQRLHVRLDRFSGLLHGFAAFAGCEFQQ